jgi:hypothetical protein
VSSIAELTEEAAELTGLAAGLNDRTIPWTAWNDELVCDEKQEVAAEEAAIAARDAWERLEAAERGERV